MSLLRPRLEYFSLTRLISAYSRRTFRVVPGQLEALKGSWPPLLHVALAVAVAGCGTGADHLPRLSGPSSQAQCVNKTV